MRKILDCLAQNATLLNLTLACGRITVYCNHIKFLFVLLASRKMRLVFWEWGKAALKYEKIQDH